MRFLLWRGGESDITCLTADLVEPFVDAIELTAGVCVRASHVCDGLLDTEADELHWHRGV